MARGSYTLPPVSSDNAERAVGPPHGAVLVPLLRQCRGNDWRCAQRDRQPQCSSAGRMASNSTEYSMVNCGSASSARNYRC